jgi:hypothetical protein
VFKILIVYLPDISFYHFIVETGLIGNRGVAGAGG